MELIKSAVAGTMESSDAYIEIEPAEGLQIRLESVVAQQFGQAIEEVVRDVLAQEGVENARIRVVDRGALECVLRARIETAIVRGKGEV